MTTIALSTVDVAKRKALIFRSGDVIRVNTKVREGKDKDGKDKFRIQGFEGLCLARKHGTEAGATFTVRKMSGDIAVERIFPLYSPAIEDIKIVRSNNTRKSKLYFVRTKAAKETRKKLKATKTRTAKNTDTKKVEEEK
jgi:large subunit ribosomal protein L19